MEHYVSRARSRKHPERGQQEEQVINGIHEYKCRIFHMTKGKEGMIVTGMSHIIAPDTGQEAASDVYFHAP